MIYGLYTALVTPFTEDGAIDQEAFHRLIERQIEAKVDGITLFGSTGEGPTVDDNERNALIAIAVRKAKGHCKIMVGCSSSDTRKAIEHIATASSLGADSVLVATPAYNKPTQEGLIAHFTALSKASALPIILYNIPSRAGQSMELETVLRLSQLPHIMGIKESSGNVTLAQDIIEKVLRENSTFSLLAGDDNLALPLIALGSVGLVSVISNLIPKQVKQLVDACRRGAFQEARDIHYKMKPLIQAAFLETNPAPIKYMLAQHGLASPQLRLPLVQVKKETAEKIDRLLASASDSTLEKNRERRNDHFRKLPPKYLFTEVQEREEKYKKEHPHINVISLGIGDTTQPLEEEIVDTLLRTAQALGNETGYVGYGPERGYKEVANAISKCFYNGQIAPEDIFISDGIACDIGRLQILFGPDTVIAVQDPSYPAYHDTAALFRGKDSIIRLPCTHENGFFPDLTLAKDADVLFLCSPNNPTGYAFSKEELAKIVSFAIAHHKIIVLDAAYNAFTTKYKTIYEIEGAEAVAIELGSFSKIAGFSGVRLSWSVVPKKLPHNLHNDWARCVSTFFNGASYLSQKAAITVCETPSVVKKQVQHYLDSALILKNSLQQVSDEVYGGDDAPYLWVRFTGKNSWQAFDHLLHEYGIITTPGVGFGPSGEGFVRISCLGKREKILEAVDRIKKSSKKD